MKIGGFFWLFLIVIADSGFAQPDSATYNYLLGETEVTFVSKRFTPNRSRVTFINLHGNEQTSLKAVEIYLASCGGGTLVSIQNEQERFINICLYGKPYRFDPNRIFSEAGRHSTLLKLSEGFNDTVQKVVRNFAKKILRRHIDSSRLLVAVHNNTDSMLSIESYLQEQANKIHFGEVYINPEMDRDDFILTTSYRLFRKIKARNINAVWENTKQVTDDGSLSVYAGAKRIPYINIEAQHDHIDEQLAMLHALDNIIKEYATGKTTKKRSRTPKNFVYPKKKQA